VAILVVLALSAAPHQAAAFSANRDLVPNGDNQTVAARSGPPVMGQAINLQNDLEQDWCAEIERAGQGPTEFIDFPVPSMPLLGGKDVYTCHKLVMPANVSSDKDVVAAHLQQSNSLYVRNVLVMECDADAWFLNSMLLYPYNCMLHTASLYGACKRW
jgi:hypothetical protein